MSRIKEIINWRIILVSAVFAILTIATLAPFKFYQERLVTYIEDMSQLEVSGSEVSGNKFTAQQKKTTIILPIDEPYTRVDIAFDEEAFYFATSNASISAVLDYTEDKITYDNYSRIAVSAGKKSGSISLRVPNGQYGQDGSFLIIEAKPNDSFAVQSIAVYTKDVAVSFRMLVFFVTLFVVFLFLNSYIVRTMRKDTIHGIMGGMLSYAIVFWGLVLLSHGDLFLSLFTSDVWDSFMDHFHSIETAVGDNPYGGNNPSNYPAIVLMFYRLLGQIYPMETNMENGFNLRSISIGMMFFVILFACLVMASNDMLKRMVGDDSRLLPLLFLFCGPVLFTIERGNCSLISFVLTLAFIVLHDKEKHSLRELSYVLLALAFCFKVYPAIFGAILLYERKYFAAIRTALYGLIMFFVPFFFFGGVPALRGFVEGLTRSTGFHYGYGNNYSLYNLVSMIMDWNGISSYEWVYRILLILIAGAMLLVMFLDKEYENRLLAMTLCLMMIPKASYSYVGVFLWIPFAVFLKRIKDKHSSEFELCDWIHLIFYVILLVPIASPYIQKLAVGQKLWVTYGQALQYTCCVVMTGVLAVQMVRKRCAAKV